MTKLDKAIKEETKRLYRDYVVKMQVDELVEWVEQSNKRIAKAALEASKLEERKPYFSERNKIACDKCGKHSRVAEIYNIAVQDQRKIIKELTDE